MTTNCPFAKPAGLGLGIMVPSPGVAGNLLCDLRQLTSPLGLGFPKCKMVALDKMSSKLFVALASTGAMTPETPMVPHKGPEQRWRITLPPSPLEGSACPGGSGLLSSRRFTGPSTGSPQQSCLQNLIHSNSFRGLPAAVSRCQIHSILS